VNLLFLVFLLVLSAAFSGSETAFFSLRRTELAQLQLRGSAGRRVLELLRRSGDLLSALLIGNLLVNVAGSVVATGIALRLFGAGGLVIAIPAVTVALLMFGEITPKLLALHSRMKVALVAQLPLTFWVKLTRPLLAVVGPPVRLLVDRLPLERTGSSPLTVAELQTACDLAVEEGILGETEGHFLARSLGLRTLAVRQIMTPRPDVVTLAKSWTRDEIAAAVRRAGFNRYPVVGPEGGKPLGLFHVKDLLHASDPIRPLTAELRVLPFVPESKDAASLLAEMRTGAAHLAAVVDEHGDFTGIVTLADCLQALIGPVGDVGSAGSEVVQIGGRRWILSGRLDLRALHETIGLELPASPNYDTLAGFLMAQLGRIPGPGDQVLHAGWRLTVLEMHLHRIERVLAVAPRRLREGNA
jgi:CBS domain containing-hemolysin-like protein